MQVLEYPVRIRKSKVVWPDIDTLEAEGKVFGRSATPGSHTAFLTVVDGPEIERCIDFLDVCLGKRSLVMGVFAFERHDWQIVRNFRGLSVYFVNEQDATHFWLGMGEFCDPEQPKRVLMDVNTPAIAAA